MHCTAVNYLIKAQLSEDIAEDDFDIGYLQGNTVISIQNKADLEGIKHHPMVWWNEEFQYWIWS